MQPAALLRMLVTQLHCSFLQERELARQAAQLAKDAAEAEVRGREAAKQLGQVCRGACMACLARRRSGTSKWGNGIACKGRMQLC